jgi:hypothetical protein
VVDLLELAQRVGVEVALTREQVQLTQELPGLVRQELALDLGAFDLASQTDTTSVTSGMSSRSRVSMPIFKVAVDEGQPAHEPFMCR